MRYYILTTTLAITIISTANGQHRKVALSGTVRDSISSEPMAGATITTTTTAHGAVTANTGFYSMTLEPGSHEIECSYLGYSSKKQSVNITADTIINFALPPAATDIDAIVVVGSGEGVGSRFGRINVSMQQLKHMPLFAGEQDVFKYFQMLPGVVGGREGSSEINIRGGSSDQTLILMDGIPIYNQNHALGFLSIFNGDALSGAELYKSGMPASIGGRLSGAISLTTRDGDRQTHQQSLTVGTLTVSTLLHGPLKKGKGSYLFSGRYFTPNALAAAGFAIADANLRINYMFYDITGKLTYQLGQRNTIAWSIYNGYDLFSITSLNRSYDNLTDTETLLSKSRQSFGWGTTASALKLNTQLPRGMMLTNTVYYSGYLSSFASNHNDYEAKTWFKSDLRSSFHEVGVRSTLEQQLGVHQLNYGLEAAYQLFKPKDQDSYSDQKASHLRNGNRGMYTAALFFQDDIVKNNWSFQLGLRVPLYINNAQNSTMGKSAVVTNLEPRLGMSYMIGSKNTIFASYDRNSQPLFSLNRSYNGFPIDFLIPIQDNILQKSDQVSLGWKYKPMAGLFFSVETYYKSMRNLYLVRNEDDLLGGRGGFIEVIIKSNHSYDITINEDDAKWIRRDIILPPKPTRELSPIRERFYITQNNSDYESRSGLIIFSLDSIKDTVTIKQDSRQFYIYVSKPGTLTSLINNAQLGNQVSMKFGGVFNIDDFNLISNKAKKLTYLDLSDLDMEYMPEGALTNLAKTNNNQYIDVVLPNKLKKLPTKAFMDSYIRFVTMPQGLEAIGDMAFNNCWRIETIKMPGSVTDIGLRAFSSSSLSTLIMAEGLINIGPFAFYGCTNLRFVNFSPTVQSIGIEAFTNCNRLISVVLPNSITQIGSGAFRGCTSLKLAQLPESIEELPDRIFESCMYMTEVNIPKSVKTIGKYAFIDCGSLSSITIPQGVTQIGAEAFNSCRRIKEIVIPQSTISIGEYAFWQCTDLKSVTIMSNLTAIEIETFYRCESLTDVNIPATVSSIGAKAFYACSDLEQITIPASVENIDEAAFYGTSQLKRITILATTPPKLNFVSYPPFGQLLSGREFRVPAASLQAYKNDPYWSYYASELVAL